MTQADTANSEWMNKKAQENLPAGARILDLSTREGEKDLRGTSRPQVLLDVAYEYGGREYKVTLSAHRQRKPKGFRTKKIKE